MALYIKILVTQMTYRDRRPAHCRVHDTVMIYLGFRFVTNHNVCDKQKPAHGDIVQREVLYFFLHCMFLTVVVTSYFSG